MKEAIIQAFKESADVKIRFARQNAEAIAQAVKTIVEAF